MSSRFLTLAKPLIKICFLLVSVLILVACSGNRVRVLSEQRDEPLYIPPTAITAVDQEIKPTETTVPSETPQFIKTPTTPTPSCINNLQFIEDLTIPDGTTILPGSVLDKRWRVENTGTCNWDEDYRLKLISGLDLAAPSDQALYPARSGTVATIRIIFTAPEETGIFQSAWQAFTPQGNPFGDSFYINILVEAQDTNS
jgi:hypothetical protein